MMAAVRSADHVLPDGPRDAVPGAGILEVGEVARGDGVGGAAGGGLGGAAGGLLPGDARDRAGDHGEQQQRERGDGRDDDGSRATFAEKAKTALRSAAIGYALATPRSS